MRMTELYLPTLKETPAEAEVTSHKLMLRAGMIRPLSAGVYSFLPLGLRVIRKIERIIREEMDKSGAQEVLLPVVQTAKIWKNSGRWEEFGPLMIRFEDRKEREFCLGPTHEEVIADLIRGEIRSYKDLPLNLYQIQTKVRDEIRPRFGVMRGKEFIMKDGYTLDRDDEGLDKSYRIMYDTYEKIFNRCGLETRVVEADTGPMGGTDSHEFMVMAEAGEDEIVLCRECDYAANIERASAASEEQETAEEPVKPLTRKETPDIKTIEGLEEFLGINADKMIKSLGVIVDNEPLVVLVRGDDQLNEVKLKNLLQAETIEKVANEQFPEVFGSVAGFIGPVGLEGIRILADTRIKNMKNAVTGANERDFHYLNVNPGRDFTVDNFADLRLVREGDSCPCCGGRLGVKTGIEVGHIFKLGTKYSTSMGATYLDENGRESPIVMGSYGIGVTRLVAAAIEQNNDPNGIIWPPAIAPYQVIILPLGRDEKVIDRAEEIYRDLCNRGIETLIDDREERAGVKFNDADLIGIPLRITLGSRSLDKGVVEVKERTRDRQEEYPLAAACEKITAKLKSLE